jgi:osmotically-inducible protein OsmY
MKRLQSPLGLNLVVWLLVAAGIFVSLPQAGAAREPKEKPRLETRANPPSSDEQLSRRVGHQLRMLAYYSVFDNIEYRVHGDRVELLGQVAQPWLKSDAEAAVKHVEGVAKITNNIEVLPISPNDDHIRLACYRAIFTDAMMTKYAMEPVPSIHIIVKNGNITLVGVVDSESDKNVAYLRASGVAGAFSVTNHLEVEHGI